MHQQSGSMQIDMFAHKLSENRFQGGIIVTFPGVLLHDGNHYCRKETYFKTFLKDILPFMEPDDVVVKSPVIDKKNRYNYIVYMLMDMYGAETRINPCDYQYEGSIVMNNKGKKLSPITDFYKPVTNIGYQHEKWWEN